MRKIKKGENFMMKMNELVLLHTVSYYYYITTMPGTGFLLVRSVVCRCWCSSSSSIKRSS